MCLDKVDEQLLPYNEITRNAICMVLHLEGGPGFVTGLLCREIGLPCINQPHTQRNNVQIYLRFSSMGIGWVGGVLRLIFSEVQPGS